VAARQPPQDVPDDDALVEHGGALWSAGRSFISTVIEVFAT
jgi:hypothetical protein